MSRFSRRRFRMCRFGTRWICPGRFRGSLLCRQRICRGRFRGSLFCGTLHCIYFRRRSIECRPNDRRFVTGQHHFKLHHAVVETAPCHRALRCYLCGKYHPGRRSTHHTRYRLSTVSLIIRLHVLIRLAQRIQLRRWHTLGIRDPQRLIVRRSHP